MLGSPGTVRGYQESHGALSPHTTSSFTTRMGCQGEDHLPAKPYPSTWIIFIFFSNFAGPHFLRRKRRWSRRRKTYFWIGDRFSFPVSGLEPAGVSHERLEIPPTSHGKGRKEGRKELRSHFFSRQTASGLRGPHPAPRLGPWTKLSLGGALEARPVST